MKTKTTFSVQTTIEEKKQIQENAKLQGLSQSEYARFRLLASGEKLDKLFAENQQLRKSVRQLKAITNLRFADTSMCEINLWFSITQMNFLIKNLISKAFNLSSRPGEKEGQIKVLKKSIIRVLVDHLQDKVTDEIKNGDNDSDENIDDLIEAARENVADTLRYIED